MIRALLSRLFPHRAPHLKVGRAGERLAARFLKKAGLKILARNIRIQDVEIDLVAREGRTLVFIEVKSRTNPVGRRPASAVDHAKKDRLLRGGKAYLRALKNPNTPFRFDVVEVIFNAEGASTIHHIRNAFAPPSEYLYPARPTP